MRIFGLANRFMNTASHLPFFAPPDGFGGGGGGPQEMSEEDIMEQDEEDFQEEFESSFESDPNKVDDSGDDDEITRDTGDILAKMFAPAKPKPGEEQQQQQQDTGPTSQQLADRMESLITGFTLGEDLIPDDFNPNDRRQMREVLANAQQAGIRTALQTMFEPVQATLNQMQRQMEAKFEERLNNSHSQNAETALMRELIPASSDAAVNAVLQPILAQAKKLHGNDIQAAVKATKKAMIGLGMNPSGRQLKGPKGVNQNKDVFTGFAELPRVKPSASAAARMRTPQR